MDDHRSKVMDEIFKNTENQHEQNIEFKKKIHHLEEEIRACRFVTNEHTQYNREYEIKMSIFQGQQKDILAEEVERIEEEIKRSLKDFDLKLMHQRISQSDEMQTVLKNSREELLKTFRKEYNAKRTTKGTQASHLDVLNLQDNQVLQLEILSPIDLKNIEYDSDYVHNRPKSGRRPRRDALPRTNTPPPKKNTAYHLLPWRVCLTNSQKSFDSPSVIKEKLENDEMRVRMAARIKREQDAEWERQRVEREEQERRDREQAEKNKTMEQLVAESVKYEDDELRMVESVSADDPEMMFLKEEERQLQVFYEQLFPPSVLKEGIPDFSKLMKFINEDLLRPTEPMFNIEHSSSYDEFADQNKSVISKKELHPDNESHKSHLTLPKQTPNESQQHQQPPKQPIFNQGTPNMSQFYEYLQDSLLQLRDELTVRLSDTILAQEMKYNAQIAQVHDRFTKQNNGSGSKFGNSMRSNAFENPLRQQLTINNNRNDEGVDQPGFQPSLQSFTAADRMDTSDNNFGTLITQAAIEHASQLTVDKCRYEFLAGLNEQLRRAQARVIAHVRMDCRNLVKLWSVRMRKDFVEWMSKAQEDFKQTTDYIKKMDERATLRDERQGDTLEILIKNMREMQEQFTDLKDQQQKILFGGGGGVSAGADEFADDDSDDDFGEAVEKVQMIDNKSSQQSQGAKTSSYGGPSSMHKTPKNNNVASSSQLQIPMAQSRQGQAQANGSAPNNLSKQYQSHISRSDNNHIVNGSIYSLIQPPTLQIGQITPPQGSINQTPLKHQEDSKSASRNPIDIIITQPTFSQMPASPMKDQHESSTVLLPKPSIDVQSSHHQSPPGSIAVSPFRKAAVQPSPVASDAKPYVPRAPRVSATNPEGSPSKLNQIVNAVKNMQNQNSQALVANATDAKARELIIKQKKKIQVMDMQLMTLMTSNKQLEGQMRELEDVKLKDLVLSQFKEQMQILDIHRLKEDFADFDERMNALEGRLNEKLQKVEIMYEEVEAGFTKNARDRSDYLNHYERMSNYTETTIGSFKEQMNGFINQLGKLSICILSVVNEEEALQLRGANAQEGETINHTSPNDEQIIHINIPRPSQQSPRGEQLSLPTEQSQDPSPMLLEIPKRNGETGKFKNISELANEISFQHAKNQAGLASYYAPPPLTKKTTTLLPQLSLTSKHQQHKESTQSLEKKRFGYTDFMDQALMSSIHHVNNALDFKNPHYYGVQHSNPLLRGSVNGVVSHRIKNLLGTNPSNALMYSNYSQSTMQMGQQDNGTVTMRAVGAQSAIGGYEDNGGFTSKLGGTARKRVKQGSSGIMQDIMNGARVSKNDVNFENVQNLNSQRRGNSQVDHYAQKLHKHLGNHPLISPTPRARNPDQHPQQLEATTDTNSSPIRLQALIATNTLSSKDNLNVPTRRAVIKKHKNGVGFEQMTHQNLSGYKAEPFSNRVSPRHTDMGTYGDQEFALPYERHQ